jgi:hypothetical protein
MGGTVSHIHDEERRMLSKHPKPNLAQIAEYDTRDVYVRAGWTHDEKKLAERKRKWTRNRKGLSDVAYRFLTSRALVDDRQSTRRQNWEATELLGSGSFGTVGLWQVFDERTGLPVDSVAIKETKMDRFDRDREMVKREGRLEDLPREAFFQDYMSRRSANVPQLRKVVHYISAAEQWRLYMEYCPHGDLRDLIMLYREFNEKRRYQDEYVR